MRPSDPARLAYPMHDPEGHPRVEFGRPSRRSSLPHTHGTRGATVLLACLCVTSSAARAEDLPKPTLELPRGRIYVGQAVEGRVTVIAGASRPALLVDPGRDVEVISLGQRDVQPLASSSIGTASTITNRYGFAIRVVPKRAGPLALPPIRVTVDGRTGTMPPRTIVATAPPSAGRTAAFLGGVGPIEVRAEAQPTSIRLGEAFEYGLTLSGPGAIGSSEPPTLAPANPGWRVEHLPEESVVNPPSRTFRARIRPDRPGDAAVPAHIVSTLDPETGTYRAGASGAVRVRVVDVPNFDANEIVAPETSGRQRRLAGIAALVAGGLMLASGGIIVALRRRVLRRGRFDPRQFAERAIARLTQEPDAAFGRMANRDIATLLERLGGRPDGEVTPEDARVWVLKIFGNAGLADRAALAVQQCDRLLYAGASPESAAPEARRQFCDLLSALSHSAIDAEKPREAPGTA